MEQELTVKEYQALIESDMEDIQKRIASIEKSIKKLGLSIDVADFKDNLQLLVQDMEKLTVKGRALPLYKEQEEWGLFEECIQDVQIERKEDVVTIKAPMLFPKARSNKTNKTYLLGTFYPIFKVYFRDTQKYKEHVVIWFEFQYQKRAGKEGFRDHDNIETKIIKDLLVPYIVPDDSPAYCDDFYSSTVGEQDATYIHIVPQRKFAQYYNERITRHGNL